MVLQGSVLCTQSVDAEILDFYANKRRRTEVIVWDDAIEQPSWLWHTSVRVHLTWMD